MAIKVERWGIFEIALDGPSDGNPFIDVNLTAQFKKGDKVIETTGFYDGDGVYKVRFMPESLGTWEYKTISNHDMLDEYTGEFKCTEPSPSNHGPVRVHDRCHFAYADGTPYIPVGTTCYAWIHQGEELERQTLETLKKSPFNKLRFCVFPKHYVFNYNEPVYYPFEGKPLKDWDFTRFNPEFFRHLERCVMDLLQLGIEADIILFHPYDRWGYSTMDMETCERYLKYLISRLAAYRNVWWSIANEYDLVKARSIEDWDQIFQIVKSNDPYGHLRSIHNCRTFYDHSKRWVTHASIQYQGMDFSFVDEWREKYQKPIVVDECGYEGNIPRRWGNLPPQEMVRRFWEGFCRATYVGHGETYLHPQDILWWSKGGVLRGESPKRIAFLRRIFEEAPRDIERIDARHLNGDLRYPCVGKEGEYYLIYFGIHQPGLVQINLPEGHQFQIDIIDTWEMTVTSIEGIRQGECKVDLPSKPYIALRIRKLNSTPRS